MPALTEPSILTASTYFWKASSTASSRRSNESFRLNEVARYFESLGMECSFSADKVTGTKGDVVAEFSYSESCKNVYKSLSVTRGGKKSNIATLRKMAKEAV